MNTSRRDFLKGGLSAGAALPVLGGAALAPAWLQALQGQMNAAGKVLVVLQVRGGWDWLNLLINDHPNYYAARPTIGIPKTSTLGYINASTTVQWHPQMVAFKTLFDAGKLAVIQGIGYPTPNLSHFESEKYWYAGSPGVGLVDMGWLGGWLKKGYSGGYQIPAIDVEGSLVPAFNGSLVPVLRDPNTFRFNVDAGTPNDNNLALQMLVQNAMFLRPAAGTNLKYVAQGTFGANNDSTVLRTTGSTYTPAVTYPNSQLSTDLKLAARYIINGLQTQCYYLSTGGFDNHANEVQAANPHLGTIANLIAGITQSVKAFLDDVKAQAPARAQDVYVMLFSEFGRRTGENGSIGTDHGHQSMAFLAGEGVIGGLYGKYPDFATITAPYANHYFGWVPNQTTDFRSLYATILERVLGVPSAPILGSQFPLIPCA